MSALTLDAIADGADLGGLSRGEAVALLLKLAAAQTRLAATIAADTSAPAQAELIDAIELARRLGVNTSWIRYEARAGRLPFKKLGRYIRFNPAAVDAALEARAG